MPDRKRLTRVAFVLLVFGLLSLSHLLVRPSIETMRAVDGVQLFGSGMCFGAAILALSFAMFGARSAQS